MCGSSQAVRHAAAARRPSGMCSAGGSSRTSVDAAAPALAWAAPSRTWRTLMAEARASTSPRRSSAYAMTSRMKASPSTRPPCSAASPRNWRSTAAGATTSLSACVRWRRTWRLPRVPAPWAYASWSGMGTCTWALSGRTGPSAGPRRRRRAEPRRRPRPGRPWRLPRPRRLPRQAAQCRERATRRPARQPCGRPSSARQVRARTGRRSTRWPSLGPRLRHPVRANGLGPRGPLPQPGAVVPRAWRRAQRAPRRWAPQRASRRRSAPTPRRSLGPQLRHPVRAIGLGPRGPLP